MEQNNWRMQTTSGDFTKSTEWCHVIYTLTKFQVSLRGITGNKTLNWPRSEAYMSENLGCIVLIICSRFIAGAKAVPKSKAQVTLHGPQLIGKILKRCEVIYVCRHKCFWNISFIVFYNQQWLMEDFFYQNTLNSAKPFLIT